MADDAYTGVDNLEAMTAARNYNRFLVDEVVRAGRGARRALDFGAGTGTFAQAVRERGLEVTCVEADPRLQEHLTAAGLNCHGDLELVPEASAEFIFTLNVLEHIEDDAAVIRTLFTRLRPGGRLYIYVPAFNVLFSSMDRKVGHFRRYRRRTLLPHLREAGFRIERARYADSLGFPVSLLFRLVGNDRGDLNPRALLLYDRVVFPVARFLDPLLGLAFGKNLAVTAVRPDEGVRG